MQFIGRRVRIRGKQASTIRHHRQHVYLPTMQLSLCIRCRQQYICTVLVLQSISTYLLHPHLRHHPSSSSSEEFFCRTGFTRSAAGFIVSVNHAFIIHFLSPLCLCIHVKRDNNYDISASLQVAHASKPLKAIVSTCTQ